MFIDYSFDWLVTIGAFSLIIVEDPVFEALTVEDVWLHAGELNDPVSISKALHAETALEPLLENQAAKGHFLELPEGFRTADSTAIHAADVAEWD